MTAGAPGGKASRVDFAGLSRYPSARDSRLRSWTERVVSELAPESNSFAVRFVGDRTMRRLNRVFRAKDRTTDVLSFPGGRSPEGFHLGDVVVSVPQASRQATASSHSIGRELRVLLLHGALHCLGYDHETDDGEMSRLERRLRQRYLRDA